MESIHHHSTQTKLLHRFMGMKGHPQTTNCGGGGGGGGGWMKKKKMAMVAVVILVAVMGVMVVQKLRDRRLFNLVIKDKDRQILNLHLLLQKEKQYAKETKRKNQDLNTKLFSLRTDKAQLNNNILEMRSTVTSMRDEQQALETTIHEMQKEIINLKQSQIIQNPCSNPQPNLTVATTKHLESTNAKHPQKLPSTNDTALGKPLETRILDAKIRNTTETDGRLATGSFRENGDGLTMKKRSFIGAATKGQRENADKRQPTPKWEEGFKPNNYSTHEVGNQSSGKTAINEEIKSKSESERMDDDDEDDGGTEGDTSVSSNATSEADQDYKEETED